MKQYIDKSALVAEIERRKKYYENIQMIKPVYESNIEDFNELLSFLELKESEDERIRKEILNYIKTGTYHKEWVAWLEKQGEQKEATCVSEIIDHLTEKEQEILFKELEMQKVQKPVNDTDEDIVKTVKDTSIVDKVEPKFRVGDFIINDYCMGRVVEITNDAYLLDTEQGIPFSCEYNVHFWTIKDAKDGDMLVTREKKQPFIFKKYDENTDYVYAYCGICDLVKDNSFHTDDDQLWTCYSVTGDVYPATKEQCDLLFQKMKESGYKWDVEKKELKKIERKPIIPNFKVGDWVVWDNKISCHIDNIYQGKESLMYAITDVHNMTRSYNVKGFDNNAHLWTIQDAKEGDVLVHNDYTFIFMGIKDGIVQAIEENMLELVPFGEPCKANDYHPATKEQRDLLFQKMKEAGYEWDAKKLELKKIEQEPENYKKQLMSEMVNCVKDYIKFKQEPSEWSEEDSIQCNAAIEICSSTGHKITSEWLRTIKNRVISRQNQEWSENDEDYINDLIKYFSQNEKLENTKEDIVIWLKSLKPQDRRTITM